MREDGRATNSGVDFGLLKSEGNITIKKTTIISAVQLSIIDNLVWIICTSLEIENGKIWLRKRAARRELTAL